MSPTPLAGIPAHLRGRVFSYREAGEAGPGRQTLRHARFERPFRGVRVLGAPGEGAVFEAQRVRVLAESFAPLLRMHEGFSHSTALVLYGCPILPGERLHVAIRRPGRARRVAGVMWHELREGVDLRILHERMRAVTPVYALVQAAGLLSLQELVVAIDHLLLGEVVGDEADSLIATTHPELCRAGPVRGVVRLRQALGLARLGAESRMETLTRLCLAAYGLDAFLKLQVRLYDREGFIGRFDMVCEEAKVIIEYDGEQHRTDRAQYLRDEVRLERARQLGYRVIRLHREDVIGNPHRMVAKIAVALGVEAYLIPTLRELAG